MDFNVSDEILGTFAPILVYWVYSGIYIPLGRFENYRLHSRKDEDEKNLVSKQTVVKGVLLQQMVQAVVAIILFTDFMVFNILGTSDKIQGHIVILVDDSRARILGQAKGHSTKHLAKGLTHFSVEEVTGNDSDASVVQQPPLVLFRQFVVAMLVLDTWQYFMHRYMHHNKFLYRHIHSQHHRLVVPYSFGALYNHPVEGLLLDTIGGALSFLLSGMSPRMSIFFFSFATIKTVDDHCGLWLPGNLFHFFFRNNSAYHDIHHQLYGTKYNYSQPFFVMWDRMLGTYMPYSLEKRAGGGLEAKPTKDCKD
ncbi:hypothetical protein RHGRI_033678 [Rhododendron griersonianum]|uniref:Fatty acid hydroxylase domain-containing protein n=1 Tax=Rhododendron griersonianum TaxID=479676 RepID=A0AAV6I082_9ERIC|nr:hypothetical protein RHGRI_033678 [Rhododendron griersonianum]